MDISRRSYANAQNVKTMNNENMTVADRNNIIAEYIGETNLKKVQHLGYKIKVGRGRQSNVEATKLVSYIPSYHIGWDKIMKVVDDIFYSRRFDTGAQSTEISSTPVKLYAKIKEAILNLSIEQTNVAVVNFILNYNARTKK